jgi:carbon storage regulator
MLVLTRKVEQKIYIGDNICLTVVEIDRGKVRLGIEAPRSIAIARDDVAKAGVETMWGTVELGGES